MLRFSWYAPREIIAEILPFSFAVSLLQQAHNHSNMEQQRATYNSIKNVYDWWVGEMKKKSAKVEGNPFQDLILNRNDFLVWEQIVNRANILKCRLFLLDISHATVWKFPVECTDFWSRVECRNDYCDEWTEQRPEGKESIKINLSPCTTFTTFVHSLFVSSLTQPTRPHDMLQICQLFCPPLVIIVDLVCWA